MYSVNSDKTRNGELTFLEKVYRVNSYSAGNGVLIINNYRIENGVLSVNYYRNGILSNLQ